MQTTWLQFIQMPAQPPQGKKTLVWQVQSKERNEILGEIKWFGRWRKYSFFPAPNTVFETDCLLDLSEFCHNKTLTHYELKKREDKRRK